jgi:hypothetical protein
MQPPYLPATNARRTQNLKLFEATIVEKYIAITGELRDVTFLPQKSKNAN